MKKGWQFDKMHPVIVAIKNCRISEFDFRSLNVYEEEVALYINPQTPVAFHLKHWLGQQPNESLNFVQVSSKKDKILED